MKSIMILIVALSLTIPSMVLAGGTPEEGTKTTLGCPTPKPKKKVVRKPHVVHKEIPPAEPTCPKQETIIVPAPVVAPIVVPAPVVNVTVAPAQPVQPVNRPHFVDRDHPLDSTGLPYPLTTPHHGVGIGVPGYPGTLGIPYGGLYGSSGVIIGR